jgi:hypothetical protein
VNLLFGGAKITSVLGIFQIFKRFFLRFFVSLCVCHYVDENQFRSVLFAPTIKCIFLVKYLFFLAKIKIILYLCFMIHFHLFTTINNACHEVQNRSIVPSFHRSIVTRSLMFALLMCVFQTFAQHSSDEKKSIPEIAAASHYIVEGRILSQSCYWSDDHTRIFTKSVIEIYKNFKNANGMDKIELKIIGGQVGDDFQTVSDVPQISKGQFGIFFIGKYGENLYLANEPITYHEDGINPVASTEFLTMKRIAHEVYQPLQNACGQTAQFVRSNPFEERLTQRLKKRGVTTSAANLMEIGIEFTFERAAISFSNGVFLEFDIDAKELLPTLTKFAKSNVYFDYSTALFGQNIAASNLIQLTKGTILSSPNYTLNLIDESPDKVKVVVDKVNDNDLYTLSTFAEQFVHAKINITNIAQSPDIHFDEAQMQGQSYFYSPTIQEQPYPYVIAEDSIQNEILAQPVITNFSPRVIRAGTGDVLTITGLNFGTTKGQVFFRDPSQVYGNLISVDSNDILSWSDMAIQVKVPTTKTARRDANGNFIYKETTAGSGKIKIQTATTGEQATSLDSLEVTYAVTNTRGFASNISQRCNLVDTNKAGGITFRFNSNFRNRTNAALCFAECLKKWRCATGVNFVTGRDTSITNTVAVDGVSSVKFVSSSELLSYGLAPTTLAITFTAGNGDYSCFDSNEGTPYSYVTDIDMIFLDGANVWYIDTVSTAPIQSGLGDFYSFCLHEQGHAQLLNHAVGASKVMIFDLAAAVRDRNLKNADIAGGINVVDFSTVIRPPLTGSRPCSPRAMRRVTLVSCNTVTSSFDISKRNDFAIKNYPNPSVQSHTVEFQLDRSSKVGINVYDMLGQLVTVVKIGTYESGLQKITFDVTDFPVGMYILETVIDQNGYNSKFIKL